jgi:hypothetical protein
LPEAGFAAVARPLRPNLPRSAEGVVAADSEILEAANEATSLFCGYSLAAHLSGAVMDKPRKGDFFVFGGSDFGSHE